jgi:hypothetical protein
MPSPARPSANATPLSQVLSGSGLTGGTDTSQLTNIANNSNQLVQVISKLTEVLQVGLAKHNGET